MIIIDASVLANALTDDGPLGEVARFELGRDVHWSGPEHLVVEAFSAIRGRLLGGRIREARAADALEALAEAAIEALPVVPLLPRMWHLRHSFSGCDAAYVAAAESHGCALLTADAHLGRARGVHCAIRLCLPT